VTAGQHPILAALSKAQYDLTSAQAWLAEVRRQVAALGLETAAAHICPDCDLDVGGQLRLAEHRYLQHDGPTPEHWERSELLAVHDPIDDVLEKA
jgi:hypothetical protein